MMGSIGNDSSVGLEEEEEMEEEEEAGDVISVEGGQTGERQQGECRMWTTGRTLAGSGQQVE